MKAIFLFIVICMICFSSCTKSNIKNEEQISETNVSKNLKEIATQIIITAKGNDSFRKLAYVECNKQKYGDYYVKLNELITQNATYNYWDEETLNNL